MNHCLLNVFAYIEQAAHPAGGKGLAAKSRKKSAVPFIHPNATPDCLNLRDMAKKGDGFRRNPAP